MKVETDCDSIEESKAKKMSPASLFFVMVVMLFIGAGIYVAVDAAHAQAVDARRLEEFDKISRQFHLNDNGVEVPMKFVSGTERKKEVLYYASIFIKFPTDLINNKIFVGKIIDLISDEIEDAFDRQSNGQKIVTAEFEQPARKVFEEIIEVVYLVEFIEGSADFTDFVMPIVTQFEYSAEHYYKLLNEFRLYGRFNEESYEENENEYELVNQSTEHEEKEKIELRPKVSLIEKLRY